MREQMHEPHEREKWNKANVADEINNKAPSSDSFNNTTAVAIAKSYFVSVFLLKLNTNFKKRHQKLINK